MASRVVSVSFCSEMVRLVGVTFAASTTMTAEASMQAFVWQSPGPRCHI
jgi:hypothetical protein